MNQASPPDLIEQLAEDPSELVVRAVVSNPQAARVIQQRGALHTSEQVRRGLLINRYDLDPAILAMMANDSDLTVRTLLAGHANTPEEVIEMLRHDAEPKVRDAVAARDRRRARMKPE